MTMEDFFKTVAKLAEIREIPQLLFIASITPISVTDLREKIIEFKKSNKNINEVDFIIHSPGGQASDSYRIIRTLRDNFKEVNIIVPFWVKSAATLLSLGGTEIIMDEFGEFGPLDMQIGKEKEDGTDIEVESALIDDQSVRRVESRFLEFYTKMFINLYNNKSIKINKNELSSQILNNLTSFYKPLLSQINPYNLGKKARKLEVAEHYAERILITYNDISDNKRNKLIDYLVNGCPDHGYVIDYQLISIFLKNVKKSSEISLEYKNTLSELTSFLIRSEHDDDLIQFIQKEKVEKQNKKTTVNNKTNIMKIKSTSNGKKSR